MFNRRFSWLLVVMLAVMIGVAACSNDENKDTVPPPDPTVTYNLTGKIVDGSGNPVSGVAVTGVSGSQTLQATTNASGVYVFSDLEVGSYKINASKSGYTFGSVNATVNENGAVVSDLIIKQLAQAADRKEEVKSVSDIESSGVKVATTKNATIDNATVAVEASADIPSGTKVLIDGQEAQGNVTLAVTPMGIDEVPPAAEDEMQMSAVSFEPDNATFSQPVTVKMPIEVPLPAGLSIPVKKYENGTWKDVGTATIDESGKGADASVTEFGQLSVQPKVSVTTQDQAPVETAQAEQTIPSGQTSVEVEVTETVEFPGGLPTGVSKEYATSLIEKIKGIKANQSKKLVLAIPDVAKLAAAKTASPMGIDSVEYWTQQCRYIPYAKTMTGSITLNITAGATQIPIVISYQYTTVDVKIECERTWVDEHNQGGAQ